MTDIDKLRAWAKAYRDGPAECRFPSDPNAAFFPVDMEHAADEIERLLVGEVNLVCANQRASDELARLRAENERLRADIDNARAAALEKAAEIVDGSVRQECCGYGQGSPPECCGCPNIEFDDPQVTAAAIRGLKEPRT